jgi:hypothetical protein
MMWGMLILVCATAVPAIGAFEGIALGGRSAAMGGASLAVIAPEVNVAVNPSLAASPVHCTISLNYVPQVFGLPELSHGSFGLIVPTSIGAFAVSGSRFGFDLYREVGLAVTYARRLSKELMVGACLEWYSLVIQSYGSATTIGTDVGLVASLSKNIHWGFSARNVNAPRIGVEKERLPRVFSTGVSYQPTDELTIAVDLIKDVLYPTELRVGAEYSFLDLMDVRGGTSSDPPMYTAGIGIHISSFRLNYALCHHQDLGTTHQIGLSILSGEQ